MPTDHAPLAALPDDDACYLALRARDARFDGRFFMGVTSTGIYCRPVCKVRPPKRENCRFFALAAQAECAGFRPCLRCRPELAPAPGSTPRLTDALAPWSVQDAASILAVQAARLLDSPDGWGDASPSIAALALRLGVSSRHVRRIFERHWGVAPLQYLQTRRLLIAKQLLTDTQLPIQQVATLSGFASVRRFHAVFGAHYRLQPSQLRKEASQAQHPNSALELRAAYRPPYDVQALLHFFATRQIAGVEHVDTAQGCITRTLSLACAGTTLQGWVQAQFEPNTPSVRLRVSHSLQAALPAVLERVRAWLDLDAEPHAIHARLGSDFPDNPGLRVPGTLDGFELAVRAVLGQQITVQAARTLCSRLVQAFGAPIATPHAGLTHLFPSPDVLRQVSADALGQLGIVRQRQNAIQALAEAVHQRTLVLHPTADVLSTLAALQALPGIGPWTAHYIAMRALRWPDAFVAGDVALHHALGLQGHPHPGRVAEHMAERWKPWRSYAVVRAWARLGS
jgi:AraC family transcriptional regulator, regulatory protein of adaptative response / DNA-3-methyladenine glycosylase II